MPDLQVALAFSFMSQGSRFSCLDSLVLFDSSPKILILFLGWNISTTVPNNFILQPPGHEVCEAFRDIRAVIFVDIQGNFNDFNHCIMCDFQFSPLFVLCFKHDCFL